MVGGGGEVGCTLNAEAPFRLVRAEGARVKKRERDRSGRLPRLDIAFARTAEAGQQFLAPDIGRDVECGVGIAEPLARAEDGQVLDAEIRGLARRLDAVPGKRTVDVACGEPAEAGVLDEGEGGLVDEAVGLAVEGGFPLKPEGEAAW